MRVKYSYGIIHNWQDFENPLFMMGKENVTVYGEGNITELLECLSHNSQLKHNENGQPYNFIVDIKWEYI